VWIGKQQKQPARAESAGFGLVTMTGPDLSVRLGREVRGLECYGPAGYRWTPQTGDRVLVVKGEGERPCVIGVGGEAVPQFVALQAERIDLQGQVLIEGIPLAEYVAQLLKGQTEGSE